jgi:hypothetical protein
MEPRDGRRRASAPASFLATMKAVFWSFFGVRKRKDHEHDAANLNPVHMVLGGLIGALVFIGILVVVVRMAVAHA